MKALQPSQRLCAGQRTGQRWIAASTVSCESCSGTNCCRRKSILDDLYAKLTTSAEVALDRKVELNETVSCRAIETHDSVFKTLYRIYETDDYVYFVMMLAISEGVVLDEEVQLFFSSFEVLD